MLQKEKKSTFEVGVISLQDSVVKKLRQQINGQCVVSRTGTET